MNQHPPHQAHQVFDPTSHAEPPAAVFEGEELRVGPGHLGQDESVTYTVLVDRYPPRMSLTLTHPLVDVRVREDRSLLDLEEAAQECT